jgi:hypothetical protein
MKTTKSTNESEASAPANVRPSASKNESPFGEIIYAYTRKQAVADGVQVDVSQTAREAGIRFPVYLTRAVYDAYVVVPEGVTCQDEPGGYGTSHGCFGTPLGKAMAGTACRLRSTFGTTTAGPSWSSWWPCAARWTLTTRNRPSP